LAAQLFTITNSQGALMSLFPNAVFAAGPIQILGVALQGPAGILPPDSQYRLPIYFQVPPAAPPHSILLFNLLNLAANSTPVDWSDFLTSQPPPGIQADAWTAITNNIE